MPPFKYNKYVHICKYIHDPTEQRSHLTGPLTFLFSLAGITFFHCEFQLENRLVWVREKLSTLCCWCGMLVKVSDRSRLKIFKIALNFIIILFLVGARIQL